MSREAALRVLAQLPPPSVHTHEVTGIWVWTPHEATEAVWALGRHGIQLDPRERALLERAMEHYERLEGPPQAVRTTLRRRCSMILPELLGDRALPHLLDEVSDAAAGYHALHDLHRLGSPPRDFVLSATEMPHLSTCDLEDYVRTRFAYDGGLAGFLRASDDPRAARALAFGALDHDPERLRGAWERVQHELPPWRVSTPFAPLGLVPRNAGVAFLVGPDTRRWVHGFELELWPQYGLLTRPEHSLYALARHDTERRLVLLAPPDDDALVAALELVSSPERLRRAVPRSADGTNEGRLCLPRVSRVLTPHGPEPLRWLDAEHGMLMRVGGLGVHDFDRPFLLLDWDSRREEALGVGLVTGPLLIEDTLASLDAEAATGSGG